MKEKLKNFIDKKRNKIIVSGIGIFMLCVILILCFTMCTNNKETNENASSDTTASYTQEDVDIIDFSLKNNTEADIDAAIKFVKDYLEKEASENYVNSLSVQNIEASEEATIWVRKRFFTSEYIELNSLSADYVIDNMIAILAEYTVDYDNELVPYDEGKIQKAFYLLKNDAGWTVWQSETLSAESSNTAE